MTPTFMDGFQNNLAQFFYWRSSSAIWNICLDRLKVKVTLEGQMIKCQPVRVITSTFMHGFQNNFVQMFSSRINSAM